MFCKKCGTEIPDNSKFCSKCGTKIDTKKTTKGKTIFIIVLLSMLLIYFIGILIFGLKTNKVANLNVNAFCFSVLLLCLIAYGLICNILKLVRKDKKYTPEQLKKRKKRKIIILGIVLVVFIAMYVTIYKYTDNLYKLQYNTKYVCEDTYITFFEDGTYERNVNEIVKSSYTFDKETKEIVCKEIQFVVDSEIDLEMHFEYLNENEIKKTSMKVLGKDYESSYGQIFSTKNVLKEKQEESKIEEKQIVKDTRMLHEEDNYEYIGFSSNSLQRMLLAFFEDGRLAIRTYTLNKYNGQYEQVGNISWGTYQVRHNTIYAGNAIMTITSPDEVSKVQLFKYNGMEFTPTKVNNDNKQTNANIQIDNEQENLPVDNNMDQDSTLNNDTGYSYNYTMDNKQEDNTYKKEELISKLNILKEKRDKIEKEFIEKEKEFYSKGGFGGDENEASEFVEYEGNFKTELGHLDQEISQIQAQIDELK